MIETNDISEEKIKMKQTMEGMKLLFLLCSSDSYAFSSKFLFLQGWLYGRVLGSHFICQNLLDAICCLALFFPSNHAEHMQEGMFLPVLDNSPCRWCRLETDLGKYVCFHTITDSYSR